jgi:hypothetical protein
MQQEQTPLDLVHYELEMHQIFTCMNFIRHPKHIFINVTLVFQIQNLNIVSS